MSESHRQRDSTDEGELSDTSGRRSPSHSPDKKGAHKHKRITYTISDDESGEMFAIQPKDSKSDRRDKDRNPLKHKHGRREDERYKDRHEEKHKRREEKRDKEKRDKDPSKQKDRHHREKDKKHHENRLESRKHKRSASPEDDLPKKREKKPSESNSKKYEIPIFAHTKEKFSAKKIEVQEVEHSPPPMEDDDSVIVEAAIVTREGGVTSFTLDSPAGPMKYSKFDSSPEYDHEEEAEKTPEQSDVELEESEPEEVEETVIEPSFDVEDAQWEDLSEEQKAMLTPDTKKRLEDEWQARLIAELPVYYPGVQGCRNVEEFKCENKIEEGTYGVVFRARDKRTEEVVALKRLKMEKEREGFPITSLREINMLLKCGTHPNIVNVREVVIGSTLDKIYLVMEFVEHDMKSLMETMRQKNKTFSVGVQKGLMKQLLSGLKHMHDLWILHRDLKTSNLLLSHRGVLKIADFGLAREFGEPLKPYTSVVVTLWYRAPELLLEEKLYSTPIDMWSVGCIMGEFILQKPLFPGQNEQSQIDKIFLDLGTPNEKLWPGYEQLPLVKKVQLPYYPSNQLRKKFPAAKLNETGFRFLNAFLRYDPSVRITAEEALNDKWFSEPPEVTPPEMFPTFPAKSEQHKAPPPAAHQQKKKESAPLIVNATTAKLMAELNVNPEKMRNSSFSLKF